jgi:hypothetical protein
MKLPTARGLTVLLAASVAIVGLAGAAHAGLPGVDPKCAQQVAAKYLTRSTAAPGAGATLSEAEVAQYKAAHDTEPTSDKMTGAPDPQKLALARGIADASGCAASRSGGGQRTPNSTSGPGYAYIEWMYHYSQITDYYCGPATVEQMSATVLGPSPIGLDQNVAASYMGTTADSGTSSPQMVNGLNHFVGVPDFGINYYVPVSISYNPTGDQRREFLINLQTDVAANSPVAANAWEVVNGPHLPGHPNADIKHWFTIGGWNTNAGQVWMADPATGVKMWGSHVPAYSWYDTYTMETILGGRGYIW